MKKKLPKKVKQLTPEQKQKLSDIRHLQNLIRVSKEQAKITDGFLRDLFENQAIKLELQLQNLQE